MALYYCRGCDMEPLSTPWRGRPCPGCGGLWDIVTKKDDERKTKNSLGNTLDRPKVEFIPSGISEFDRVIGGGLVKGGVILISGPPGSGKTTMLLKIADCVSRSVGRPVVIASGEQSYDDIALYAIRLKIENDQILILGMEGNIEKIVDYCVEKDACLVIVDSLQKAFLPDTSASVGSVASGKEVSEHIMYNCKKEGITAIVISRVNNEGEMAGGTTAEHDGDTILELDILDYDPRKFDPESDADADDQAEAFEKARWKGGGKPPFRVLNVGKNRFAGPKPPAYFKLGEEGMRELKKKSKLQLV